MHLIVKLLSVETGEIQEAVLTFLTNSDPPYRLRIKLAGGGAVEVKGRDYFECLRAIRLKLEPRGLSRLGFNDFRMDGNQFIATRPRPGQQSPY